MAAYDLRVTGHTVRVFEALDQSGGMLRYGLPAFRLPTNEVDAALQMLEIMGVVFQTATPVGKSIEWGVLLEDYDAVILALGLGQSAQLGFKGEGLPDVWRGLDFLRRARGGRMPELGDSVVVIGGGNTAVDAALTCRRVGVREVRLVCVESREAMPAFQAEIIEAIEEGVIIEAGWGPLEIEAQQGRLKVDFGSCLSLYDEEGNFNPKVSSECGMSLKTDTIILAVGQTIEASGLPLVLLEGGGRRLASECVTLQSPVESKVFVCGDATIGPASVVQAFASGAEAALSVNRFLSKEGLGWGRDFWSSGLCKEYEVDINRAKGGPRGALPRREVKDRHLMEETERTLSGETARIEAERCLSCGRPGELNRTCWYCLPCEIECPAKALEVRIPYLVR
jgi:NADPH-dependent glutamate synthase beta subunit-like oxidoreductase